MKELQSLFAITAVDYDLESERKLQFLHNLFDREAKCCYRTYTQNQCFTFEQACAKVKNEFRSIYRQNRVRNYLQSLKLTFFLEKSTKTFIKALVKRDLQEKITKFTPQGPKNEWIWRGEGGIQL